jgi:hypothetical protein
MRIYEEINNEEINKDPDWLIAHHFGIGMDIRNLLRAGGFIWLDPVLDQEWEPIVVEAVLRMNNG